MVLGGSSTNLLFNQLGVEVILAFKALDDELVCLGGHTSWSHRGLFGGLDVCWLEAQQPSGEPVHSSCMCRMLSVTARIVFKIILAKQPEGLEDQIAEEDHAI